RGAPGPSRPRVYPGGIRLPDPQVRRDLEVLEVEGGDLLEGGGRDEAAVDLAVRLVDGHEHEEARARCRHHPDEGRDVRTGDVAVRPRLLRRARLAGDGVTRNRGELGGPLIRDDASQHAAQLAVDAGFEHPPPLRLPRRLAEDVVDEMRLDPLAAVCDGGVDGSELNRRDRDALPDRDGADRGPGPVRGQEAAALAGEVDTGAATESEAPHPVLQAALAEVPLGDHVRPDVRGPLEDLLDLQRLQPVWLRVVDHAVCYLKRAGDPELRVRCDGVLRERSADRHDLEHRARLED